ncbi:unnamed protein product [Rangifer tarandus platyrhynchus]|uniref:Uncharacterized protein n=2 Tax=Rangifer tarandus platyrhynchus TaxID=3082113 RepID=A0ACB0FDQ6_RANTA|nr:unnamed protein product [Rangifer tarandus platyrhynchus]CAI9710643.1 unnamed protein product [Rangifer tarandus platyrhynchus]
MVEATLTFCLAVAAALISRRRTPRLPRNPAAVVSTCAGCRRDTQPGGAPLGPATRSATGASLPHPRPSRARSQAATGALDLSLSAPSEAPATRQRPRSGPASPAPGREGRPARSALRHRAQRFQLRCGSGSSSYGGTSGSKRELPSGLSHRLGRRSGGEGARPLRTGAFPEWTSTAHGGGAQERA